MISRLKYTIAIGVLAVMPCEAQPQRFTDALGQLHDQIQQPKRSGLEIADALVADWVDVRALSDQAFGNYVEQSLESYENILSEDAFDTLVETHEKRLVQTMRSRLVRDLARHLNEPSLRGLSLRAMKSESESSSATVAALSEGGEQTLTLNFDPTEDRWRITGITVEGRNLGDSYRDLSRDILDGNYSLPALISRLAETPYMVLDDFSSTPAGQTPTDWGAWRDKDKDKPLLYRVERSGEYAYMAAVDSGYSVILGKFVHWNPREYPIMTWCWRADVLPPGGNEFLNHANDSAAGLYVIFSQNWLHVPKQLKYVWSSTLPEGTIGRRDKIFRPWFFVMESGDANRGKWTFEQVDLERDHKLKLGGPPADRTIGLGLLTDANSTRSYAEAYYANLRVWKRDALTKRQIVDDCATLPPITRHDREGSATATALSAR